MKKIFVLAVLRYGRSVSAWAAETVHNDHATDRYNRAEAET
jgi:hypothetical protein